MKLKVYDLDFTTAPDVNGNDCEGEAVVIADCKESAVALLKEYFEEPDHIQKLAGMIVMELPELAATIDEGRVVTCCYNKIYTPSKRR